MKGVLLNGVELPRQGPLQDLLEAERRRPDQPVLRPLGAPDWSVGELAERARACAGELVRRGVQPGDRVALMSRNHPLMVAWWYGAHMAGAVEVQINADLQGPLLQHVLTDSDPTLIVAQAGVRRAIDALDDVPAALIDLEADQPTGKGARLEPPPARAGDLATILYTSGTTGPSKGVMLSHAYWSNYAAIVARVYELGDDQVFFLPLPFFHVDSHVLIAACLQTGAVLAFPERFSASRFWPQLAATRTTMFGAVASMLDAVAAQGPPPDGMQILELYGQTEADCPIYSTPAKRRRGAAGWPCAGSDVAIVDEHGRELPAGKSGEIVYRPNYPGLLTLGYWRRPDATVAATGDLWWHSGDSGHFDADGFLYFDGRLTDFLRYRGENVSAWELESTVRQAPDVADAAAVALRDPLGGEDVIKLFVVPGDGAGFEADVLFEFCRQNLPRFAVPRYIEPIAETEVVRSPGTGVIQKHRLPARNGPLAVDRELSGTP